MLAAGAMAFESEHRQYRLSEILVIWAGAALPMCGLAWSLVPALIPRASLPPAICYWLALTVGMAWQAVVALWIIRREEGSLQWLALRDRLWLHSPINARTGQQRAGLYWWILPCLLAAVICALAALALSAQASMLPLLSVRWNLPFPWLWHWPAYANLLELGSLAFAHHSILAVAALGLWLVGALVIEELLFRGVLLTRMSGVFGKWDWLANAGLYAAYSLFQPWVIPLRLIEGVVIAWPARRFHSNWLPLIIRGGASAVLLAVIGLELYLPSPKPLPAALNLPGISRHPEPADLPKAKRFQLTSAPKYNPNSDRPFQVDLRSQDASMLDLRKSAYDLSHALFDSQTRWPIPERMPADFDWKAAMELGKSPGLGVRALHQRGITGRGVAIGIVDLILLTRHQEYRDRLKYYEEMGVNATAPARMHGPAVASLAVGQTVGVAPEAALYYIGLGDSSQRNLINNHCFALGVKRLLEVNRRLPAPEKIRAISLSAGWLPGSLGYDEIQAAIREAEAAGIFVIDCGEGPGEFRTGGLTRAALANPEVFESYEPWSRYRRNGRLPNHSPGQLFVPLEMRTAASPTGANEYAFLGEGAASWTPPYLAGMYALVAQVRPGITPREFRALALKTGRTVQIEQAGRKIPFRPILDPAALLEAASRGANTAAR